MVKVTSTIGLITVFAVFLALSPSQVLSAGKGPKVYAAASLKNALDDIAASWQSKTGERPVIVYGATPALAKQIIQGAEADIFISADLAWMDDLEQRGLIKKASRADLVSNDLVLIAPKGSSLSTKIEPRFPLGALLGDGRLAIAGVRAVPAGRYGKQALDHLKIWDDVKNRLAQAENVRAALRLVARGEAPLGIVYESDASADPGVTVLGVFPSTSHAPIIYPVAQLRGGNPKGSSNFLAYLKGPEAAKLFTRHGFSSVRAASTDQVLN